MKKLLHSLVLLICISAAPAARAQVSRPPLEDIINAIKVNRVDDIVKYFDNFVPITIDNNQSVYSHNQAEVVLKDFFDKNNPRDFVVMDNGSPTPSSKFAIGAFTTPSGKYNVYVLLKLKDNSYILQEIRLNKD
ncbi:MAG: DUF4783 domain-containing protein [Bacteroidota bacterium]